MFCDLLKLPDLGVLFAGHRSGRRFEAMVDVVVKEGALRISDRFFDRVQLLGNMQTRLPPLDHFDEAAELALGTL